jgi:hypothetical protein
MEEEKIMCHQCDKDLVIKFIELKDLVFCSNQCLEEFKDNMGQKIFYREYGDAFVPGEGKGWVPRQSNEYVQMCIRCPKKLTEACQSETEISAAYHDTLAESEERHWCCHARFLLSAVLSDGTVPVEAALKIQRYAENKSKEQNLRGVTTITFNQSFADLVKNFTYRKLPENPPEVKPMTMSHFGACLLCNEAFGRQCEELCEREFELVPKAKTLLEKLWCAHAVNVLADMLIDREDGEQLIRKIIPYADQVAQEKQYPGTTVRCLFIALGRML